MHHFKSFESCISEYVEQFIPKNYLKFGYVKGEGCEKAFLCLNSIIDYSTLRASNVFVAALDSSKAFGKVNHYGLLLIMIKVRVPLFVIRVIENFYSKLSGFVYCKDVFSNELKIRSGIRLGRILSAVLFNLYIIDLICSLRDRGYGCEIGSEYCGVINYADDIILISGSLVKMQFVLDICYNYGCQYDIVFNGTKSQFICYGSK